MKWITANDLKQWATDRRSQGYLPELIERLIRASVRNIKHIHFPSIDNINSADFDGELSRLDDIHAFVPEGSSVWEVSTEDGAQSKADNDYESRKDHPLPNGFVRNETTYVQVSLRHWQGRGKFETTRSSEKRWKKVKALNAISLESWIGECPAVALWLRYLGVGIFALTIKSIDYEWEEWCTQSNPQLNEHMILIGREQEKKQLLEELYQNHNSIIIKTDSPEEAQAFVIASIRSLKDNKIDKYNYLCSRTIVVKNEDSRLQLNINYRQSASNQLIIILQGTAIRSASILQNAGHTVVLPIGNSYNKKDTRGIFLRRPTKESFANGLQTLTFSSEQAGIEARKCGCSLTVFQYFYPRSIESLPPWANDSNLLTLIPAILAGGWNDENSHDQGILLKLSGKKSYGELNRSLQDFFSKDVPPLLRTGNVLTCLSPLYGFLLVARHIIKEDLERFYECATEIFSEINPTVGLSPQERINANINGKKLSHSQWLRDGVAQTLLIINFYGDNIYRFPNDMNNQEFVNNLVRQLPGLNLDDRVIASLSEQLPILAEAAPPPFMEALENLLKGDKDELSKNLFSDDRSIFSTHIHVGILWALEGLAWNPQWLLRVCLILTKLAEIDPNGINSNRPLESLRRIFLPWYPMTNANLSERIEVIDLILKDSPSIGWILLTRLLPNPHDYAFTTYKPLYEPVWSEAGKSKREIVTHQILNNNYTQIIDRVVDNIRNEPARWKVFIDVLHNLPPDCRTKTYDRLDSLLLIGNSNFTLDVIWEQLRKLLYKHIAFLNDASWVLQQSEISRLSAIVDGYVPSNPKVKYKWLFDEDFPDLPIYYKDHDVQQHELKALRHKAMTEIYGIYDIDNFLQFASNVLSPWLIGEYIVEIVTDIDELIKIIEQSENYGHNGKIIAKTLSYHAYDKYGEQWKNALAAHMAENNWNDDLKVNALLGWPDSLDTVSLVESLGNDAEDLFWSKRNPLYKNDSKELCRIVIEKLLKAGNFNAVIKSTNKFSSQLESDFIVKVLYEILKESKNRGETDQIDNYDIDKIFKVLRKRDDISIDTIAALEYSYLPLLLPGALNDNANELVLSKILASEPSFFIQIICDVYKPSSAKDDGVIDKDIMLRAEYAYKLLRAWKTLPGITYDGTVDVKHLTIWIDEVRRLAKEKDMVKVTDIHIGNVLYYLPDDPVDKAWPISDSRDLIEALLNTEIGEGIRTENYNSRGVVSSTLDEIGEQELQLSKKWKDWANTIGTKHHRLRDLLNKISNTWKKEADQNKIWIKQQKLRH